MTLSVAALSHPFSSFFSSFLFRLVLGASFIASLLLFSPLYTCSTHPIAMGCPALLVCSALFFLGVFAAQRPPGLVVLSFFWRVCVCAPLWHRRHATLGLAELRQDTKDLEELQGPPETPKDAKRHACEKKTPVPRCQSRLGLCWRTGRQDPVFSFRLRLGRSPCRHRSMCPVDHRKRLGITDAYAEAPTALSPKASKVRVADPEPVPRPQLRSLTVGCPDHVTAFSFLVCPALSVESSFLVLVFAIFKPRGCCFLCGKPLSETVCSARSEATREWMLGSIFGGCLRRPLRSLSRCRLALSGRSHVFSSLIHVTNAHMFCRYAEETLPIKT